VQPFAVELREFTDSIWTTTLGFEVAHLDELPLPEAKHQTLVSCVQFAGAWRGGVVMSCPAEVAREVASVMFGIASADVSVSELTDAIGELANMTGGNLKALLPEPTTLSLPSVTEGTDYSVRIPGARLVTAIAFEVFAKPVVVSLLSSE
jgi:chemotaxis protein CheX